MSALALAGAALLVAGGLIPTVSDRLRLGFGVQAAGMMTLAVAGLAALLGGERVGAPFRSGISPALGLDHLSGFFLVALAVTSVPTLIYAGDYVAGLRSPATARGVGALTAAFLLALTGVLAARDVTTFLAFWELMTVMPAAAILVARRDRAVRRAVFAYLAITHVGGAGVWLALLTLSLHGAIGHPAGLAAAGAATQTLVASSALVGFGTKAGLVPLHSWLPRAHPVAPAHLSALMSGMMIKVALYGLIRVEFQWLGERPRWLGITLLALGLVSALGGVIWALAQAELKRLLAYSSIDNIGIVALGLGASLLFGRAGDALWAALAFGAAMLHIANHAVFKTLLFLGAGAFERAVGRLELDRLGGLLVRMPWTGGAFLVGALATAGLPPLSGFASEWLTLESLLHVALTGPLGVALAGAVALAGLAAAAALALICFVKVSGLVLLGHARSAQSAGATERPLGMRAGVVTLAGLCCLLGVVPGLVLPTLAGLAPGATTALTRHLGLQIPGTGSYPAPAVALGLILLTAGLARMRGHRRPAPAQSPSWACGQPVVPQLAWTSAGFTKPLRLVLESLLRPDRTVETVTERGIVQRVTYACEVRSLVDRALYEPAVRAGLRGAALARLLQTGNVRTYAGYLLGAVIVLLVLVGTGALG